MAALVHVLLAFSSAASSVAAGGGDQPLSKIGIHRTTFEIHPGASVDVSPLLLGLQVSIPKKKKKNARDRLYHLLQRVLLRAAACSRAIGSPSSPVPEVDLIWSITTIVDHVMMSNET